MKLTNYMRDAFIRAAMGDVPSVDYDEQIRVLAIKTAVGLLPPKVRELYEDKALRDYVATFHCYEGSASLALPGMDRQKATKAVRDAVAELKAKREAQRTHRADLEEKLRSCAYGASTRKILVEMLPEFQRYLPADNSAADRSVPVVANVVAAFVQAGWPKGKTPTKPAKKVSA